MTFCFLQYLFTLSFLIGRAAQELNKAVDEDDIKAKVSKKAPTLTASEFMS